MSLGSEGVGLLPRINRSHKITYLYFPNQITSQKFPIAKSSGIRFPDMVTATKTISKAVSILFPILVSSSKAITKTTGVTIV